MSKALRLSDAVGLIREKTGRKAKLIGLPVELIHFTGDLPKAVFLTQLLYWSDKASRGDKFVFKSRKQWQQEIGLSEYQVQRITKELKRDGLVETKVHRANGSPTLHYRIHTRNFITSFSQFLDERCASSLQIEQPETGKTLTENTTENTFNSTERGTHSERKNILDVVNHSVETQDVSADKMRIENSLSNVKRDSDTAPVSPDFQPAIGYRYKAASMFPNKSQPLVTEKFIAYYLAKPIKKSLDDWNRQWWNWINTELTVRDDGFTEEQNATVCGEIETMLFNTLCKSTSNVFHNSDVEKAGRLCGLSSPDAKLVLEGLLSSGALAGTLGRIEDCFFYYEYHCSTNPDALKATIAECVSMGLKPPELGT